MKIMQIITASVRLVSKTYQSHTDVSCGGPGGGQGCVRDVFMMWTLHEQLFSWGEEGA